jgi:hypothetical protein
LRISRRCARVSLTVPSESFSNLINRRRVFEQDYCEDFAIEGAHFRTESIINAFGGVKMLLGEGIVAGQGAEAQRSNQSGGFGLREEAEEVREAGTHQPGERAVFGEELTSNVRIGGVQ